METLSPEKLSWLFLSLMIKIFFQNDVFKLQEVFSEHGIKVFHEKGLGSFQAFFILQIWAEFQTVPLPLWRRAKYKINILFFMKKSKI
jgi:hypothetical protein